MTVLVDTSALYALLDEDDASHGTAVRHWHELLDRRPLTTHLHVVVESSALVQRRLGMEAARRLHQVLLPAVDVRAVEAEQHARAVERWLSGDRRGISLVDVTSFVVMQDAGIDEAFAFDEDFERAGFRLIA